MVSPYLMFIIVIGVLSPNIAFAQSIQVNETTPCFLNYTAGWHVWENCGVQDDYLKASLIGFEWVTGGFFSLVLVGLFVLFTYIKYHKAIYPIIVGVAFIPLSVFLVPDDWWMFALAMVALGLFAGMLKAVKNHTSDFN